LTPRNSKRLEEQIPTRKYVGICRKIADEITAHLIHLVHEISFRRDPWQMTQMILWFSEIKPKAFVFESFGGPAIKKEHRGTSMEVLL
jgi:hypothetical protein